jgi:hypothetical protein
MLVSRAFLAWARMHTRLRAHWKLLRKPMLVSRAFLAYASRMPARLVATTTTRLTMATMTRKRRMGQRQTQSVGWAIRRISMNSAGAQMLVAAESCLGNKAMRGFSCTDASAEFLLPLMKIKMKVDRESMQRLAQDDRLGRDGGWRMEVPTAKSGLLFHVSRWFLL